MEKCGDDEFIDKYGKKCVDKCENVKSLTNNKCLDTCPTDSTANSDTKVCECDQTKPFINVAGDGCLATFLKEMRMQIMTNNVMVS